MSLDQIVSDAVSAEPRVNEDVISTLQSDAEAARTGAVENSGGVASSPTVTTPAPVLSAHRDISGIPFDPSIHESMPDGSPRKTTDGKFRRKRGGGGKKANAQTQVTTQTQAASQGTDPEVYRRSAVFCSSIMFQTFTTAFGEAWKPTPTEQTQIETYATAYFQSQDFKDIPPGFALCLCVGMYAAPRCNDPETRKRIGFYAQKLGLKKAPVVPPTQA